MTTNIKPYMNIGLHLLGWTLLGFLLLFYVPLSWNVQVPTIFWIWQSILLVMMMAFFYVNASVIVPQTLVSNKPGLFFLWIITAILATQVATYFYADYTDMHAKMALVLKHNNDHDRIWNNFIFTINLLVLALSTGWAMLTHWQKAAQREKELEQDKIIAELSALKMQINPHFFFNSLNSVYSLTYIDVEDSRKALLTLSRMMRYVLYATEDEMTTLSAEVAFLKDYVSLMRLRATDKIKVHLEIAPITEEHPIAPMLLLPFIENAFKHGIDPNQDSDIVIRLWHEQYNLHLHMVNGVFDQGKNQHEEGGVGLINTQRRLELLYSGKHSLRAGINGEGNYEVNLKMDLRL